MLAAETQEMPRSAGNDDLALVDGRELNDVTDQIPPRTRACRHQQCIFLAFLDFVDKKSFSIWIQFAGGEKIIIIKWHEFIEYAIVQHQLHLALVRLGLVGDKSFGRKVCLYEV